MSAIHELDPQLDGDYIKARMVESQVAVDELQDYPGNELALFRAKQTPYVLERAYRAEGQGVRAEDVWMATAGYIAKLEALPAQVYDECDGEAQILKLTEQMVGSIAGAELTQSNLPQYIEALKFIFKGSGFIGKAEAAAVLRKRHNEVKELTAPHSQEAYQQLLGDPDFYENLGDFFMQGKNVESDKFLQNKKFFNEVLGAVGVADESTIDALNWNKIEPPEIFTNELFSNMAAIEKQRPGGLKLLHDFYGIRAFNRYAPSALIGQIDSHAKTNRPYGVVVSAVADHNGYLAKAPVIYGNHTHDVRVIEADSSVDMARRLVGLDRVYGPNQKISFAVLQAHGGSDGFLLGNHITPELSRVTVDSDYHPLREERGLKRFFVEHAPIVYFACDPAVDRAQALSNALNTEVIGPDGPTYKVKKTVNISVHDGLHLTPNLETPVLYKNGKRVQLARPPAERPPRRFFGRKAA